MLYKTVDNSTVKVKKIISKIRYAGIDSDTDQSDIKCITLSNSIAFLLRLLASGFIPLFLLGYFILTFLSFSQRRFHVQEAISA
jgi:hypothetical protein